MESQKIIFINTVKWNKVFAISLYCDKTETIALESSDGIIYSGLVPNGYDYVYFVNEKGKRTFNTHFNECCYSFKPNGYCFDDTLCLEPYKDDCDVNCVTDIIKFEFEGLCRNVYVWKPKSYYKSDCKNKYGVIYMFDGQNLFKENSTAYGSWNVPKILEFTNKNYIVVGIDNANCRRDSNLTPNIGSMGEEYKKDFNNGTGVQFAEFVVNEIMPYINSKYNVYSDREHTAICGSSSGGLESFYMGVSYNDIFGVVGVFSPAFLIYENGVMNKFIDTLDVDSLPKMYIYTGATETLESDICLSTEKVYKYLVNKGIGERAIFDKKEENLHNEACWSGAFIKYVEMLK